MGIPTCNLVCVKERGREGEGEREYFVNVTDVRHSNLVLVYGERWEERGK